MTARLNQFKKPLLFVLPLVPIAIVGGYFTGVYGWSELTDDVRRQILAQIGNNQTLYYLIAALQTLTYALILGFLGYLLSERIGLMKPVRFEKKPMMVTIGMTLIAGLVLCTDLFYFRNHIPQVAAMYQENGLMPSQNLAGLMAAAIISDTVMFKSPTCTPRDRILAERLARHARIDLDELGKTMFSRGASPEKSALELIRLDQKEFHLGSHSLAISQITTVDSDQFMARKEDILAELQKQKSEKKYDLILLMVTNVLKEGTELLFAGDPDIIRNAFSAEAEDVHDSHVFLPKVLSRKKQIVPALSQLWG